ncbi:MAG: porin [Acidobacteriota bacterium]
MRTLLHRTLQMTALAVAATFALTPAVEADDWVSKWSNGHKIENKDKGHKLKFGGRIQADYTFADVDDELGGGEDGFEFRRARFYFSGTVYDNVQFKAQYDFAGGDAEFKDVYIAIKQDWGKIKFGHYKEYFSFEEITSSNHIPFLERSTPTQAFAPVRNSGLSVEGKRGDTFTWGFGWWYEADSFGESISEDATNITGRIGWRPIFEDGRVLHIGVGASLKDHAGSVRYRARPEAHLADRFVNTGTFAADDSTLLNFELAGTAGPLWYAAEYFSADVSSSAFGDPTFDGFYVAAGYFLTGESRPFKTSSSSWDRLKPNENFGPGKGAWEIAARWSSIDLNDAGISGGEQDGLTLGVNWYLNPATRLMINYVNADVDAVGDASYLLARWSFTF